MSKSCHAGKKRKVPSTGRCGSTDCPGHRPRFGSRAENNFDELKNQWGWGGFTTHDLKRCLGDMEQFAVFGILCPLLPDLGVGVLRAGEQFLLVGQLDESGTSSN
jgi:hypothetical protein